MLPPGRDAQTYELAHPLRPMNHNPYQAPTLLGEDAAATKNARQRVGPIAIGAQCFGVLFVIAGALGIAVAIFIFTKVSPVVWAELDSDGPPSEVLAEGMEYLWGAGRGLAGSTLSLLLGGLAFYAGRRLRRLDSLRWAYTACVLCILFSPMLIVTLPLGIYGLFVLRRADVRAVIQEQQAARTGTMPLDEPQPV